jgi:hypothetical protein
VLRLIWVSAFGVYEEVSGSDAGKASCLPKIAIEKEYCSPEEAIVFGVSEQ